MNDIYLNILWQMMKVTPSNFVGSNYVFLGFKLRPEYSPVFLYRHCFLKRVEHMLFLHGRNTFARNLMEIIPRTAHPGVPPTTPRAETIGFGWYADARSCSSPRACARSAHITSLFSGVSCWDDDAPGLSRCSGASGCPGSLLTPCSASCRRC